MRRLVRTPDRNTVNVALDYLQAAARSAPSLVPIVISELRAAERCAEWDGWADRQEVAIFIEEYAISAAGDRLWTRAYDRYQARWLGPDVVDQGSIDAEPNEQQR